MLRDRIASLALTIATAIALAGHAHAQSLYWLDTNFAAPKLSRSNLDGVGVTTVALPAGTLPEGLAADASGRVYWTEAAWSGANVNHALYGLTNIVALVSGGSVLRGIAIDEAADKLYWTTSNLATGAKVMRSNLTGTGVETLISLAPGANPRGIAVNPALSKIYWADFDLNAIYSANLNGSSPAILVMTPGSSPYGVAVHPSTNNVYWTEYGTGQLRRTTSVGGAVTMIASGLANPTYVAIDVAGGRLFLTEGGAGAQRIRRMGLTGGAITNLPPPLSTYGGIGIGSGDAVEVAENPAPSELAFDRVWPTPSNGPIHLAFALPRDAHVKLTILDLQGREVAVLEDGTVPAGRHERVWSGVAHGELAPTGVYFARMSAEGRSWARRLVLTR